ncbi:MAG: ferrochelatase [Holosporales bacterium]
MSLAKPRIAVVLFNLGGPDSPKAVQPFLQNLFSDPAILRVPPPVRWFLARLISRLRAKKAQGIYNAIGGGSPLLPNTEAQAAALDRALGEALPDSECRSFIAMRYWHPLTPAAVKAVKDWQPDTIVLLSLYPQFSTTTTESSFAAFQAEATRQGLSAPQHVVCCYPEDAGWTGAVAEQIRRSGVDLTATRLLFSAHGLPQKIVDEGDPYPLQVNATVQAVCSQLGDAALDTVVCYQSKVGPLKWLEPSTEHELHRAGAEKKAVLVIPIAFVSEHSETLVELDIEYKHLAEEAGVSHYTRLPTVMLEPLFIKGLAVLVQQSLKAPQGEYLCSINDAVCQQPEKHCSRQLKASRPG